MVLLLNKQNRSTNTSVYKGRIRSAIVHYRSIIGGLNYTTSQELENEIWRQKSKCFPLDRKRSRWQEMLGRVAKSSPKEVSRDDAYAQHTASQTAALRMSARITMKHVQFERDSLRENVYLAVLF